VGDIESTNLPAEMRGEAEKPDECSNAGSGQPQGKSHRENREDVEARQHRLRPLGKEERGGLDPDKRIVLAILMRIDRVVTDHPADRPGIEKISWNVEPAENDRPAHESSPGERKPEPDLRPVGEPLHEGIDRDNRKRGDTEADRKGVE